MTIREGYEMMFLDELEVGILEKKYRLGGEDNKIFTLEFDGGVIRYQKDDSKMVCITKNKFKLLLNPTYKLKKIFKKDNNE